MKEFIENLIGRLEELKKLEMDREENITEDGYWEDCEDAFEDGESNGMYTAYTKVIKIVNQLAEEYSVTGGWIPCSSGQFPEEYCNVLLTVNHFEEAQKGFLDHGVWYAEDGIKYASGSVIAWRSLPDLYVPEE